MRDAPDSQWVLEAGVIAIGCLCNGADAGGAQRRARAQNVGAVEFALKVAGEQPVARAMRSHKEAYAAAVQTVSAIWAAANTYGGPPVA